MTNKIILASASPRRCELLRMITDDFTVITSEVSEDIASDLPPSEIVKTLAQRKAVAVVKLHPQSIVIGADTIVVLDGEVLGKPQDEIDAVEMLGKLSGNTHTVYTGVCICSGEGADVFYSSTKVKFCSMTGEQIAQYVATGEPMDKAGAYGIQGCGGLFIEYIVGDYYSVMGLPVNIVYQRLLKYIT